MMICFQCGRMKYWAVFGGLAAMGTLGAEAFFAATINYPMLGGRLLNLLFIVIAQHAHSLTVSFPLGVLSTTLVTYARYRAGGGQRVATSMGGQPASAYQDRKLAEELQSIVADVARNAGLSSPPP